jgi:hypothetical protein
VLSSALEIPMLSDKTRASMDNSRFIFLMVICSVSWRKERELLVKWNA